MTARPVLLGLLAGALLFAAVVYTKRPSHDRDWQPHLGVTPSVARTADSVRIAPVRDWTYGVDRPLTRGWLDHVVVDPDALARVWFVVEPHPGIPMMAHTLVLFEFEDGALIGLTIEARKQRDEKFAPIAGLFRRFELVYVWATPRDLLTRRAVHLNHEVFIYPLDLTAEQGRAYLRALIERTAALRDAPRFYNTLHSNCTNELAKTADLNWQPAFVLTGRADEALFDKDLIAGEDFEAVRAAADVTETIRDLNGLDADAFNAALLGALGTLPPPPAG